MQASRTKFWSFFADGQVTTESLLDLIRQCRNERKELIIRIVDADKPLGKDEYMLLRQKKNYTPLPEEPEKPKRKKRV